MDSIIANEPSINLRDFFAKVGKKLSTKKERFQPAKNRRKNDETLQDACYRLLNLALLTGYPQETCCELIISTLIDYESDKTIKAQFAAEIYRTEDITGRMDPESILSCARRVDRILQLGDLFAGENLSDEELQIDAYAGSASTGKCSTCNKTIYKKYIDYI